MPQTGFPWFLLERSAEVRVKTTHYKEQNDHANKNQVSHKSYSDELRGSNGLSNAVEPRATVNGMEHVLRSSVHSTL